MLKGGALQPGGGNARRLELAQLRRLEIASLLEATTLVGLVCVAVPLKHLGHFDNAVRVMGPVHGLAFLTYAWTVLQTVTGGGWSGRATARLLLAACVPFAGFTTPAFLRPRLEALAAG
jgi:integral membrane protein